MALIKKDKLKAMKASEIDAKIQEIKLEMSKEMALSEIGSTVKNPGNIREMRRTIARLLTKKRGGSQ
ncbi:MAG: 50S ribosomal protein L29 [Candidatus Aenigmarchaeota archaeon]|nr:50S ribosomal protein L29 [Candidatus Aenigmarchaeota archaeon]